MRGALRFAASHLPPFSPPFLPFPMVALPFASALVRPLGVLAPGIEEGLSDFDAKLLLEWAQIPQPPYFLAGLGLAIGIVCGLTFSTLVQQRLEGWKQDRLALLPLAGFTTVPPWIGLVLGVTLFIGGSLQVFGFSAGAALLVAFLLSLATAGALWVQLVRLMQQVQSGNFKAVDFDNFDEFF